MIRSISTCLILHFCCLTCDKVIQVAPGSDVTLNCSYNKLQPYWYGPKTSNKRTLDLRNVTYLLVEDFQRGDEGYYSCVNGTKQNVVKLQTKHASSTYESVLFRGSKGTRLRLFCQALSAASYSAQWSWRPPGSDGYEDLAENSAHFGKRLHIKKGSDNDFSLSISPLHCNDSGHYKCELSNGSKRKQTRFELVTVRVHSMPQELTEGDDVSLVCNVTVAHIKLNSKLMWIDMQSQKYFESKDPSSQGKNILGVKNVTVQQRHWLCAVFHLGKLKALIPLTLNVSERTPTQTPAGHTEEVFLPVIPGGNKTCYATCNKDGHSNTTRGYPPVSGSTDPPASEGHRSPYVAVISCVCTVMVIFLVVVPSIVYWTRKPKEAKQQEPPTSQSDCVTYTVVHLKKKQDAEATECDPVANDRTTAEEEVIYATVNV